MIQEELCALRRIVNHSAAFLVDSGMLDKEVTQAFAWAFQSEAARVCSTYDNVFKPEEESRRDECGKSLQSSSTMGDVEEEEAVVVIPLRVRKQQHQIISSMIFSMPFVFGPLDFSTGFSDKDRFLFLSSVACFNVGLAVHTQALVSSKEQDSNDMLQQAGDFYLRAHNLIDNMDLLIPEGTCMILYLAICNNLAETYTALGMHDDSLSWQESLLASLWAIPSNPTSQVYQHLVHVGLVYDIDFERL